jgi:uncharacterized membrane protein
MAKPPFRPNPPQKNPTTVQTQVQFQQISGPLPDPETLKHYDSIQPGFAERIVRMAEAEGEHRRSQEVKMIDSDIEVRRRYQDEVKRGQILGFLIGLATIVAGAYTATHGAPLAGGFIGTTGVVGLVSAFIYGRSKVNQPQQPQNQNPS